MSKATNAPDTDKASTFRLGNGVPLQGLGLLVDGPRNQGVTHCGKQDGRRKLHHPVAVGSKSQCSCLGFIGMTRTIAYMSYFSDFTYFAFFKHCTCFLTAHSHHSNSSDIQAVFTACHELCLTMEEEEVVAVGFPSPVDELKVPDNWCLRNGELHGFSGILAV